MRHIVVGDYVVEVLDRFGNPIPGAVHFGPSLADEQAIANDLATAHGAKRWRIFHCVADSSGRNTSPLPSS